MPANDTHPAIQARMDAAYRRMSPAEKVGRMAALVGTLRSLALAGIRAAHPNESDREHHLRLTARYIDRQQMIAAFGWDPDAKR
jgi:hypothetical protein